MFAEFQRYQLTSMFHSQFNDKIMKLLEENVHIDAKVNSPIIKE
jgi:hypothetical protein